MREREGKLRLRSEPKKITSQYAIKRKQNSLDSREDHRLIVKSGNFTVHWNFNFLMLQLEIKWIFNYQEM